jgi:ABC-type Fe3+/spermidine/putrescine transport system ATPase subunit
MSRRRAMVLPIVIWCVAVAALITSATQLGCYRQAVMGREAMSKVQARWAARAGVETVIAISREGVTILLIEQNAKLALEVSSRGYVMESGEITIAGDAKSLLHDPKVRAAYLGVGA